LATVSGVGLIEGYLLFKPLPMIIAIIFVAARARLTRATTRFDYLLIGALVFSLVGDVLLMLPGNYFIQGLGAFLVAHVFYIALFRQGQGWFPNRGALALVLGVGAAMYAVLWGGLTAPALQIAVACYVAVIALMAAQAIGRAAVVGNSAARWVALGACVFMVSDALIAVNKFVTPVPMSGLWVLATYYLAQWLIVHNARPR
jgi:alkylglycerol monooxygenase